MTLISAHYVQEFPLIPGGGLFFVPLGVCILLKALYSPTRMILVWVGIAAGMLAIFLGGKYLRDLPPPTIIQVAFFALAIIAESVAFRVSIRRPQRSVFVRSWWIRWRLLERISY